MCKICKSSDDITRMGAGRKKKVKFFTRRAVERRTTAEGLARKLKKEANTPTGRDDRDWLRVAQTELTDMTGRMSLDDIIDKHGPTAKVIRFTREACPICFKAFGPMSNPKKWRAGSVPEELKGAVHPWCKCMPWRLGEVLISKAEPEVVVGDIEMTKDGARIYSILKRWTELTSVDGLRTIEEVVLSTPATTTRESSDGYLRGCHGYCKSDQKVTLFDIRKVPGAFIIPASVDTRARLDGLLAKKAAIIGSITLTEYVSLMKRIIPLIVRMPEFWEKKKIRHLSSLFGYGTRTDFIVVCSSLPKGAIVGEIDPSTSRLRATMKEASIRGMVKEEG